LNPSPVVALFSNARISCIAFGSANIIQLIHYNEDVLNGAIHPGQAPPKLARPVRSAVTGLAPDRAEQEVDAEGVYRGLRCQPALARTIVPHPETQSFSLCHRMGSSKTFHVSRVLSFLFHRGEYR
jgi:hypothetical protein